MFEGFRRKYDYSENPQKAHISGKTLRDTCTYVTEGESTEMVVPSRNVTWRAGKSLPLQGKSSTSSTSSPWQSTKAGVITLKL